MMQGDTPDRTLLPKLIYNSCVTWKIKNVFNRRPDMNNTFESPIFKTKFNVPVTWKLALCLKKKVSEHYATVISLRSAGSYDKPPDYNITAVLTLTNIDGTNCGTVTGVNFFTESLGLNFHFDLIDEKITSCLGKKKDSGEFTIKCDLYRITGSSPSWSSVDRNLKCLSSDLNTFHLEENLTDLVLSVGAKKFHVHSAIVKLRSPYVADELAKTPGEQDVSFEGKCDASQLLHMIRYWYSGNLYYLPTDTLSEVPSFVEEMKQRELNQYLSREEMDVDSTFEKLSVKWILEDEYRFFRLKTMENKFRTTCEEEQTWKLHFYPKGETGESDNISLCVEQEGKSISTRQEHLEIFFIYPNSDKRCNSKCIIPLGSPRRYVFKDFISHAEFWKIRLDLTLGKTITIGCVIQNVKETIDKADSNPQSVEAIKHPYEVLAGNLKDLLENKKTSDVTLKTKDGEELSAHSAILAARSRSFELDLRDPESHVCKTGVIELPDVESNDLNLILKYMYHAEIELDLALARKLYPAVRKYKIKVLEDSCSKYLKRNLNVDCALEVLNMADTSKDSSLRETSLEFIVKNFDEISMTEKWHRFLITNPKLASEIEQRRRLVQSNSK